MFSESINDVDASSVVLPDEWREAAETIKNNSFCSTRLPIAVICGPKNSGKSTFSHHLANILLQKYKKVGYLDTDVGQPEFTACGILSFTFIDTHNQDFTIPCIKNPERSFFYGDISSKRNPALYKSMVQSLFDYYQVQCHNASDNVGIPLIVNTPGWVKGVGYDTLVDMLRYIAPSYVVKISTSSFNKNLPDGAFWCTNELDSDTNVIEINTALRDSNGRSLLGRKDASLQRDKKIMAYFRQCLDNHKETETIKELANELSSHRPYQSLKVPKSESFYGLNMAIVGLGVSSDDPLHRCVGLGLVRGVDPDKGVIYVITPLALSVLEDVDTLLLGLIQIPSCLLQVEGCISPYMAAGVMPV